MCPLRWRSLGVRQERARTSTRLFQGEVATRPLHLFDRPPPDECRRGQDLFFRSARRLAHTGWSNACTCPCLPILFGELRICQRGFCTSRHSVLKARTNLSCEGASRSRDRFRPLLACHFARAENCASCMRRGGTRTQVLCALDDLLHHKRTREGQRNSQQGTPRIVSLRSVRIGFRRGS